MTYSGDGELYLIAIRTGVHVSVRDDDCNGVVHFEAADVFEDQSSLSVIVQLVVEERCTDQRRVVGDAESAFIAGGCFAVIALPRDDAIVLVADVNLIAGDDFQLLVVSQLLIVVLDGQPLLSVPIGERDFVDGWGCTFLADDDQSDDASLSVGCESDVEFSVAFVCFDDCGLIDGLADQRGQRGRVEHAVRARLQFILAGLVAQQLRFLFLQLTTLFASPNLNFVQAWAQLSHDRERVVSVVLDWLAIEQENSLSMFGGRKTCQLECADRRLRLIKEGTEPDKHR